MVQSGLGSYQLSDTEWDTLSHLLKLKNPSQKHRKQAEACLYRFTHRHAKGRTFGWHQIPDDLGVPGSTLNRRFRDWGDSGVLYDFIEALLLIRFGKAVPEKPVRTRVNCSPMVPIQNELQRAYRFFNHRFLGNALPEWVAIAIEPKLHSKFHGFAYTTVSWVGSGDPLYNIAITAPAFEKGYLHIYGVLLHEMAHLFNDHLGIDDCDTRTQYHNQDFRNAARLLGLSVAERTTLRGYSDTSLNQRAIDAIEELRPQIDVFDIRLIHRYSRLNDHVREVHPVSGNDSVEEGEGMVGISGSDFMALLKRGANRVKL